MLHIRFNIVKYFHTVTVSTDEDESEEEFIDVALHVTFPRRPQIYRPRPNYFTELRDYEFIERFRLSKEAVIFLVNRIQHQISSLTTRFV